MSRRVVAEPCGSRKMLENGEVDDSDDMSSNIEESENEDEQLVEHSPFDFTVSREKRGPFNSCVYKLISSSKTLLMTATTKSNMFSTKYHIVNQPSGILLAKIDSDWKSLTYAVSGPSNDHLFDITYADNFLGRNGTRSMTIKLNGRTLITKPPVNIGGCYYQSFGSNDATQSIKNFVLVDKDNYSNEVCVLIRKKDGSFSLRIKDPVTPFHAFCISVTAFHTGLFHR